MSAKIYTLKDSFGNQILPRTTSKAVYTEDGYILDDKLADIQNTANEASNIATNAVSEHNSDTSAHSDIRTAVSNAATAAANAQTTADGKMNYNANLVQFTSNALKTLGGTAVDVGAIKIVTGSYAGTGTNGTSGSDLCKITLPFVPKLVVVQIRLNGGYGMSHSMLVITNTGIPCAIPYGYGDVTRYACTVSISGTTISWGSSSNADQQMNKNGDTYDYIAFG